MANLFFDTGWITGSTAARFILLLGDSSCAKATALYAFPGEDYQELVTEQYVIGRLALKS